MRVLTREQLAAFLRQVHPRYRLMFRFLAATGLRASELVALRWVDLRLDGSEPVVKIRRALVRGKLGPPKSKHGIRDVPLDASLVSELRRHRSEAEWPGDEHLVFCSTTGTALNTTNLRVRVLDPVMEEIGAPWASLHTFRHTRASLMFETGLVLLMVMPLPSPPWLTVSNPTSGTAVLPVAVMGRTRPSE